MNLFDWLKEINYKKSPSNTFSTDDWKSFTPYMIHRFLSLHPELIILVNEVQMFNISDKEVIYNAYKHLLPKQNRFAKYIKGKKDNINEELCTIISRYFEISKLEGRKYIKMLSKEEIISIVRMYGHTTKQIEKMING